MKPHKSFFKILELILLFFKNKAIPFSVYFKDLEVTLNFKKDRAHPEEIHIKKEITLIEIFYQS